MAVQVPVPVPGTGYAATSWLESEHPGTRYLVPGTGMEIQYDEAFEASMLPSAWEGPVSRFVPEAPNCTAACGRLWFFRFVLTFNYGAAPQGAYQHREPEYCN